MKTHGRNNFLLAVLVAGLGSVADRGSAQTFTTLYSFTAPSGGNGTNSDGSCPRSGLILSGSTLYGTTWGGGSSGNGTIFAINTDGTGFTNHYSFTALTNATNSDGVHPYSGLVLSGNTLYGTANEGGASGAGTIFKLSTNGTGFTTLYNFSAQVDLANSDGAHPHGGVSLSGSSLYGATTEGGTSANGTIFRLNTDGTAFTSLHTFDISSNGTNCDGANPYAGLILSGNTLYGAELYGGDSGNGTVYKVNIDGTSFTTLHHFGSSFIESGRPMGSLILSGNTLYGTGSDYTFHGYGSVFAVNTNGMGFTALHNFTGGIDGGNPWAGLTLSGETLYGTTAEPVGLNGTVFAVNRDGTDLATLHYFTGCVQVAGCSTDGAVPIASLLLVSNTLYGTTFGGGSSGYGTVFSLIVMPRLRVSSAGQSVVLTWPTNFTGFTLQSTANFISPVWVTNSQAPVIVNGLNTVTNPVTGTQQFYRLSQ